MLVLLSHLWPALLVASAMGAGFAGLFGPGAGLPSAMPAVRFGAVLALAGAALASVLSLVPGRPGLWLDIALLCAVAYGLGVAVGSIGRVLVRRQSRKREGSPPPVPAELG